MSAENIIVSSTHQGTTTLSGTDTIDLSMLNNMATNGSPYTVTTGVSGGFTAGTGWTTNTTSPWFTQSPTPASTIKLDGEGADIVVNGYSLVEAINNIQQRLNCLQVNPELEAEWDQLRDLGDQYRALEKKLQEQGNMWTQLKAMPPPDIT